ncbi:MAG: hypothetical protein EXR93_09430 [Gemmatimonadetes bacterium]|nr:hypothetical protein [Gemmatimonadota bacterium]
MTWIKLHLMINHFPVILTVVGTAACILGAGRHIRQAWTYGALTLALAGVCAIPAWITGNQSHIVMEDEIGIPEGVVEPHELMGEATMWIMIPMAGLAAFTLWRASQEARRGPLPNWVRPTLLTFGIAGSVMIGYTALLGGRIGHNAATIEAIRSDSARTSPRAPPR